MQMFARGEKKGLLDKSFFKIENHKFWKNIK